ncbi:hypothetical protein [Pseudomonas aeruginosa]|uniref:hypothetical protein n=1 Tax=Pseudomonas aeruginosa TaxID=287 RepID=UPI0009365109|nr:hypothetical protein [Pseudomonas aeruginosa]MBI7317735.1 hypothetical protein [Pseudomonas aeruginosa]MBI7326556.1 hypothetical protein [Pseudomonas aeruginosa]MBI7494435.1 hypothetical protein [Pseudomonas aeruginosa]MEE2520142.1 hypothetical protein [Pseudomonas aeruginosa]NPY72768.1 hypothetical protein [Pseudomonas aeruginosa]
MSVKYDVVATVGQYEKDGQTKYLSRKVGVIVNTKHGFRLKMDACFNPAGCPRTDDGGVWLALFEPKEKEQQQRQQQSQQAAPPASNDFDDDIPFSPLPYLAGS